MKGYNIKKPVLVMFVLVCLTSCSERNLYQRLDRVTRSNRDSTIVKMAELFPFPWDTMYIFYPDKKYLRPQYQELQDIERRIMFVKDGEILYQEDEIAVSEPYYVEIYPSAKFFYTPETAVFSARKFVHNEEKKFYKLRAYHNE